MHGGIELVFQEPEILNPEAVKPDRNRTNNEATAKTTHLATAWAGWKGARIDDALPDDAREAQGKKETDLPRGSKACR